MMIDDVEKSETDFYDIDASSPIVVLSNVSNSFFDLCEYILFGNTDPYTGQKLRHGIVGPGSDEFISNSTADCKIIFETEYEFDNGDIGIETISLYLTYFSHKEKCVFFTKII